MLPPGEGGYPPGATLSAAALGSPAEGADAFPTPPRLLLDRLPHLRVPHDERVRKIGLWVGAAGEKSEPGRACEELRRICEEEDYALEIRRSPNFPRNRRRQLLRQGVDRRLVGPSIMMRASGSVPL